MSRLVDLGAGAIAGASAIGAGVLAAAPMDYTYPSPDFNGIAILVTAGTAALGAIGIFITQMVGLHRQTQASVKQKETHDLVNSLSVVTRQEAKDATKLAVEAAFAEGKLAGKLEEQAARAARLEPTAPSPQVPIPKQ